MRRPGITCLLLARHGVLFAALAACSSPSVPPLVFAADVTPEQREILDPDTRARLEALEAELREGELEAATSQLESLVAARPGLAEAWLLLGQARLDLAYRPLQTESGRQRTIDDELLTQAESALRVAQRLDPGSVGVERALAVLFEREGHLEAAYAASLRVLEQRAFDPDARLAAARCAAALDWERRAVPHLEALRGLRPHAREALALETAVYEQLARGSDEAELRTTWLERLLRAWNEWSRRVPEDPRGPRGVAAALRLRVEAFGGTYDKASVAAIDARYEEARALAPADAEGWFEHAEFAETTKRVALAESLYRRALDFDPQHLPSLLNLGSLLWGNERKHEARLVWQRALPLLGAGREREQLERLLAQQ